MKLWSSSGLYGHFRKGMLYFLADDGHPDVRSDGMVFTIGSPAFKNGDTIPTKFTGDGENVSPALTWTDPPQGTKSFVMICDDPDAPMGTWTHWVIYNIPGGQSGLPEGVPPTKVLQGGSNQGLNSWGSVGYGGPSPPPGTPHRYFFRLYAMNCTIDITPGSDKRTLLRAIEGRIIGQAVFQGTYGRKE